MCEHLSLPHDGAELSRSGPSQTDPGLPASQPFSEGCLRPAMAALRREGGAVVMAGSVLAIASALLASPAAAQDCTLELDNRIANCGFDSQIPPWTILFGLAAHDSTEGFAANGSAMISGGMTGNGMEIHVRQCVSPVAPSATHRFGGALRGGLVPPDECWLQASTRSAADCSGGGTFAQATMVPAVESWTSFFETELTTTSTTVALQLSLVCIRAAGDFEAHFDDAYFVELPLFEDGFELGNTSAWSSVVP